MNYALDGTGTASLSAIFGAARIRSHVVLQVQIALTDITARKKAEAYLEYLGKHDVLTRRYNRSFHVGELNHPLTEGQAPGTIAAIDLDGLQGALPSSGHSVGDLRLAASAKC